MNTIPTGFTRIDSLLGGGLRRSEVTVLTSIYTAMGKTSLATSILRHNLSENDCASLLFTLEGSEQDAIIKLAAMQSGVDTQDIRRGTTSDHEHQKIRFALRGIEEKRFWLYEHTFRDVDVMRAQMTGKDIDFVVVDYIELMQPDDDNYALALVDLTKFAKEYNAAVLVVSHCHGELSQAAVESIVSTLLVLNREGQSELAEVTVRQKRQEIGVAHLYFYPPTTRFFNSREEYELIYHGTVEGE